LQPQPTDLELLRRARAGDGKAFHALVDRFARPMFGLAYSLLGDAHDAEDVVQETFAGAFKSLSRFEERASVKTWLSRILVNQVARLRRDHGEKSSELPSDVGVRDGSPAVDAKLDLSATLQKLSLEHREVIVLREIEQLSYEEMAQVLDVPRGTVESRLHRARESMKQLLSGYLP